MMERVHTLSGRQRHPRGPGNASAGLRFAPAALGIAPAALGIALLAAVAAPAAAVGQDTDGRWLPWMGCWEPVVEDFSLDAPAAMLCFQPLAGDVGVEMVSIEEGEIVARETVRADGGRHDVSAEGCTGWERGDFATRAGRVFLAGEQVCEGGVERVSTGLLALVSSDEWVDVKVVTAGDEKLTWVTRYELARPSRAEAAGFGEIESGRGMAIRSARVAATARPSIDDVIEAAGHADPEAVAAWLVERDFPLDVDADELARLADAGVSESVIDVVVAVSFPEHFAVDDSDRGDSEYYGRSYGGYGRWGLYDPYYGSLFYSPFSFGYGYGYGRGFGYRGFYGPTIIRIDRGDSGGRVINGLGYRRGTTASGSSSGSRDRRPAATSGSSSRGSSIGSSSRGSGRSSTGRTARRRGGGGGGL